MLTYRRLHCTNCQIQRILRQDRSKQTENTGGAYNARLTAVGTVCRSVLKTSTDLNLSQGEPSALLLSLLHSHVTDDVSQNVSEVSVKRSTVDTRARLDRTRSQPAANDT